MIITYSELVIKSLQHGWSVRPPSGAVVCEATYAKAKH